MEITVRAGDVLSEPSQLAMLATYEDVPLSDNVAGLLEPGDYRGRAGQTVRSICDAVALVACCWWVWQGARMTAEGSARRAPLHQAGPRGRCRRLQRSRGVAPCSRVGGPGFRRGNGTGRLPLLALPYEPDVRSSSRRARPCSPAAMDQVCAGIATGLAIARGVTFARTQ
jgi:hypothetical protein